MTEAPEPARTSRSAGRDAAPGEELAAWLAAVDPVDLLPARRRDEALRMRRPFALVAAGWFDDSHGYALVRDARDVTYGVPFVVDAADDAGDVRLRGRVRRAVAGDGTSTALISALPRFSHIAGQTTRIADISALSAPFLPVVLSPIGDVAPSEAAFDVDQTNDLVVVGGRAVVKWELHPQVGRQPGPERLATLTSAGFAGTPATYALVALDAPAAGGPHHVATVGEYVPGALDGWEWAVDEVRALAQAGASGIDAAVTAVAELVAGLHVALSGDGVRPAGAGEVRSWVESADATLTDAAADLDASTRHRVEAAMAPLAAAAGTPVVATHGDLHVGQVLRAGDPPRYLVLDFDGSPTDSQDERLAPQPVARDVASMLASWDHVGRVVLHRTEDLDDAARARVHDWIAGSARRFLDAYTAALAAAGCAELLDDRLLMPYQVLQECREYVYARRYLPHWRYVPDAALPALLDRYEGTSR